MSTHIIEARSLSSLTALASNPPSYPRNPTHVRNDPLVLYIARVPGSKDVFLSPMKPREKVVTAEDIQSSLYFLHLEQPGDAQVVVPPDFREPSYQEQPSISSSSPLGQAMQRKAVPGISSNQNTGAAPVRKPVPGTLASISNIGNTQNISAGNYTQRPGMLAPDYSSRRSFDSAQHSGENQRPTMPPRRSYDRSQPLDTFLTLIRRDPASGAQWNVARIEDPAVIEVSSSISKVQGARKRIGAPMYIEVTNPGYSKFLHSDNADTQALLSQPGAPPVRSHEATDAQKPIAFQSMQSPNTFRRRLWMEGSQFPNGEFGHRKNSSDDFNSGRPASRGKYDARANGPSMDSRPAGPSSYVNLENQAHSTIQVTDRHTSFRGYVFNSPWNGRCEFTTGAGGGSLKCRHIVPGLQGAAPAAMSVSELRFNLPSGSSLSTPKGEETSKRSSFFHRGRNSRHSSSVSIDQDGGEKSSTSSDRLDLSLGQEFAGGGFGGKQAKLGKIIIEDEGLKMVDLIVAANLGLWWRAYEKANIAARGNRGSF